MVFPAHRTTASLLLLAELSGSELDQVYAAERYRDRPAERPDLASLRAELARIRRKGFAVDRERSERGLVAVGVAAVRGRDETTQVGLAVSMPSVRCDPHQLPRTHRDPGRRDPPPNGRPVGGDGRWNGAALRRDVRWP